VTAACSIMTVSFYIIFTSWYKEKSSDKIPDINKLAWNHLDSYFYPRNINEISHNKVNDSLLGLYFR